VLFIRYCGKTLNTIINPSSLSVRSALYAVLCGWLSYTCLPYQTLCSLCSTALTAQSIWWTYVIPPLADNLSYLVFPLQAGSTSGVSDQALSWTVVICK